MFSCPHRTVAGQLLQGDAIAGPGLPSPGRSRAAEAQRSCERGLAQAARAALAEWCHCWEKSWCQPWHLQGMDTARFAPRAGGGCGKVAQCPGRQLAPALSPKAAKGRGQAWDLPK